jgi:hypothetical protein
MEIASILPCIRYERLGEDDAMLFVKAFGVWLLMLLAAFINGAIREMLIIPRVGEYLGHVIGVIGLSGVVFALAGFLVNVFGPFTSGTLLWVGIFWLGLSLLFEFGFFHYVRHEPWHKLLADYNIFRGRLLLVVWLSTLFSPLVWGAILHQG